MATNTFIERIKIMLQGARKAAADGKKVESSLKKIQKAALAAGGTFFAAQGIINGMKHIITLSMETEKVGQAFQAMGGQFNFARMDLHKLRQAVNGTVSDMELMTQANKALQLGVADNIDDIAELFDIAQRMGKAFGRNVTESVDDLTTGIGRQSMMILDNLGIIVRAETAYQKYKDAMGITNRTLDDQEKKLAFNQEAMRQAREAVKMLGDENLSTAENMAALTTQAEGFFATGFTFVANTMSRALQDMGIAAEDGEVGMNSFQEAFNALVNVQDINTFAREFKAGMQLLSDDAESAGINMEEFNDAFTKVLDIPDLETRTKKIHNLTESFRRVLVEQGDLNLSEKAFLGVYMSELERIIKLEVERIIKLKETADVVNVTNQEMRTNLDIEKHMQMEKFKNFEIEIEYVNKLKNLYSDFSGTLNTISEDQVNAAMAVGASQQDAAKAAGAAATAFIMAELQKSIAMYITDAFNKFGIFGGVLGAAASGVVGNVFQRGIAGAETVFAAEGFDGIVTEPTMFVAGEAGAEYVDIDPLTNEGNNKSKGINITFTGNVMSQEFIESEAIPMIKNAIRKGGDIGIG